MNFSSEIMAYAVCPYKGILIKNAGFSKKNHRVDFERGYLGGQKELGKVLGL